jgi:hypothetical protein
MLTKRKGGKPMEALMSACTIATRAKIFYFDGIGMKKWELSSQIRRPQINIYEVLPMM